MMRRLKDLQVNENGSTEDRPPDLRVLSLGVGVQSTALVILALTGQIQRPDHILYSNVHADMPETTQFLEDELKPWVKKQGHEITEIDGGSLLGHIRKQSMTRQFNPLPAWTKPTPTSKPSPLPHDCCYTTKVTPIKKKIREILGLAPGQHADAKYLVEVMLGISKEEPQRARPAWEDWQNYTYPLLEQGLNRQDCKNIIREQELPVPPRSSCFFCPLQSRSRWKKLKKQYSKHWRACVKLDEIIRTNTGDHKAYLHPSGKSLEQAIN